MNVVDVLVKKYLKRADVLLTVCTHRTIDIDVMAGCMQLFANKKHQFTWCPVRGDALISRARSRAASMFLLERQEDCLMFVDDDVQFTEADAIKLIDGIVAGYDVVGGMYVQKGTLEKTCCLKDGDTISFGKKAPVQEVLAASTGFLAIHRKVFQGIVNKGLVNLCHAGTLNFYPFFKPFEKFIDGDWKYLSEDWGFCDLARQAGFKIWIDGSILLKHKGEYAYDLADKARLPKPNLEDIEITLR